MKIQSAVEEYLVEIEVRKYTPKTIRSYRCNLNLFLRFCAEKLHVETVEALTPAVVRQFSRCMSEAGRKGTYINGVLKSIKSFIQYCYEEGYGGFDTRKTFKWCKEEKPVITAFSPEQVRIMLQSCRGHDYLSLRDYAILTLLFETGIRCWELCCIREEDIHDDFIIINGKNHKQRVVPITPVLKKAMLRYESGKEKYFMLRPHDAFYFLSFHGRQLTDGAVEYVLRKRGEGIEGVRVSPHTCRHFFAQQQVKMGTDLYTISRLLGHENIGITQTYLNSLRDQEVIEIPKLPSPREDDLSQGILETIDLESYRNEAREVMSIRLEDADTEVAPVPAGKVGHIVEPEMDLLSVILSNFNDMFGNINWNDADNVRRQILEIPAMVSKDEKYQNAMKNSDEQSARLESERALQQVIFSIMADNMELFKQFQDNPSFKKWLSDLVFNLTYNKDGKPYEAPNSNIASKEN